MRLPEYSAFHALQLAMLRGASLIVPPADRTEWRREWATELWHVRQSCAPNGEFSWCAERTILAFCWGSYQDAISLQRHRMQTASASRQGSPRQCLLWLCAALAACAMVAHFLPGLQSEQEEARAQIRPESLLIQADPDVEPAMPSISMADYADWRSRSQRFFAALAFYSVSRQQAQANGEHHAWTVADASSNLFEVLGLEARDAPHAYSAAAQAWLSPSLWRRVFASDPGIAGKIITLANRRLRIMGVAPAGTLLLPKHADVWVLEPEADLAQRSGPAKGYVVGLLSPLGQAEVVGPVTSISSFDAHGDEIEYHGFTFARQTGGPLGIYDFAFLLAVLALPAITTVFRSESDLASHQPARKARLKRSLFLATKMGLVAAIGYFASLDLAYCGFADYSSTAEFLQFVAAFNLCLFGLRWALVDQSRRCPVCLRCVTHPAQVGTASRTFLGWNGTEMICRGGHALLHVPSLPTSWFSRERWMYLDPSWNFLFADSAGRCTR